jgi:hypothetical protein
MIIEDSNKGVLVPDLSEHIIKDIKEVQGLVK